MGSSKYEFDPEQFDKDLLEKLGVAEIFREGLKDVIYKQYLYQNGGKLSYEWKRKLLVEVVKEFIG